MTNQPNRPFSDNFDTLIAVLTHLSNCDRESRTAPNMARDLGLEADIVQSVLSKFPAFFRRSRNEDDSGNRYYTVHLRYARRRVDGQISRTERLTPAELGSLFDLVSKMVANENELLKTNLSLESQSQVMIRNSRIMIAAAVFSGIVTIISAIIEG